MPATQVELNSWHLILFQQQETYSFPSFGSLLTTMLEESDTIIQTQNWPQSVALAIEVVYYRGCQFLQERNKLYSGSKRSESRKKGGTQTIYTRFKVSNLCPLQFISDSCVTRKNQYNSSQNTFAHSTCHIKSRKTPINYRRLCLRQIDGWLPPLPFKMEYDQAMLQDYLLFVFFNCSITEFEGEMQEILL